MAWYIPAQEALPSGRSRPPPPARLFRGAERGAGARPPLPLFVCERGRERARAGPRHSAEGAEQREAGERRGWAGGGSERAAGAGEGGGKEAAGPPPPGRLARKVWGEVPGRLRCAPRRPRGAEAPPRGSPNLGPNLAASPVPGGAGSQGRSVLPRRAAGARSGRARPPPGGRKGWRCPPPRPTRPGLARPGPGRPLAEGRQPEVAGRPPAAASPARAVRSVLKEQLGPRVPADTMGFIPQRDLGLRFPPRVSDSCHTPARPRVNGNSLCLCRWLSGYRDPRWG
uniref:basic proline-rich protein-like n=1 Tax=Lonchura striata TaxID=40157 RepID=UPI000B4C7F4A|nr:basic proline-rich protein-like [Lonchura striata domestica]